MIEFKIVLSRWVRLREQLELERGMKKQSRLRPGELEQLPSLIEESEEWEQLLCAPPTTESGWRMEIPVANSMYIIVKSRDAGEVQRRGCDLNAYTTVGTHVKEQSSGTYFGGTVNRLIAVVETGPWGVEVTGLINRDELTGEIQKHFHRKSLTSYHFATFSFNTIRSRDYETAVPTEVEIDINALPEGLPPVEQSWTLQLYPHPVEVSSRTTYLYRPPGTASMPYWTPMVLE